MSVVIIDGRSGAGKTSLAQAFVAKHPEFQLVQLDDAYQGWDGLDAASRDVPRLLTEGSWTSWDWTTSHAGELKRVDPRASILLEGAGALTRESRELADVAVWMDLPEQERKARAFERDGETYAPHWDRWAAQEAAHIERERPQGLADLRLAREPVHHAVRALEGLIEAKRD